MKETKRKTFKFYRSYYDIFNELEKDKDKIEFIKAVLDKQFLGINPKLKGIVKFAYVSQLHSIEKQVKGWQDATGQELTGAYTDPLEGCTPHPKQEEEVKEKVKEKEKEKEKEKDFILFWDKYPVKKSKAVAEKSFNKLSKEDIKLIFNTLDNFIKYKPFENYNYPMASTYLNQKRWLDEININKSEAKQDDLVSYAKEQMKLYGNS